MMNDVINTQATAICSKILFNPVQRALLADQKTVNQQKLHDFTGKVCLRREYDLTMAKLINLGLMPSSAINFINEYLLKTCQLMQDNGDIQMLDEPVFNLNTYSFVYYLVAQTGDTHLVWHVQQALNAHHVSNTCVISAGLDSYLQIERPDGYGVFCEVHLEQNKPYIMLGETDNDTCDRYVACLDDKLDIDYLDKIMNILYKFLPDKKEKEG